MQVLKRLGDFFSASDNNGDGVLTLTELTKNLRSCGYRGSEAEIKVKTGLHDTISTKAV